MGKFIFDRSQLFKQLMKIFGKGHLEPLANAVGNRFMRLVLEAVKAHPNDQPSMRRTFWNDSHTLNLIF